MWNSKSVVANLSIITQPWLTYLKVYCIQLIFTSKEKYDLILLSGNVELLALNVNRWMWFLLSVCFFEATGARVKEVRSTRTPSAQPPPNNVESNAITVRANHHVTNTRLTTTGPSESLGHRRPRSPKTTEQCDQVLPWTLLLTWSLYSLIWDFFGILR
jgi:hypothetical protein